MKQLLMSIFLLLSQLFVVTPVLPKWSEPFVLFLCVWTQASSLTACDLPKAPHNQEFKHFSSRQGFFQPLAEPLQPEGCHLKAVCSSTVGEITLILHLTLTESSPSFLFLFFNPLSTLIPPLFSLSSPSGTAARRGGLICDPPPLSRTQMGIRKSGLVSNNYGNYFNILKQKDGAIDLFEMLTVSLNFHPVV